jgi:hypothetical protein
MAPRSPCLALLLLVTGFALPAHAAPTLKETLPSITVTGEARTEIVPDIAIISLAVATERPTADAAAAENARAAQALISELTAQRIDPKDIRTESVTLMPVYDEQRDANGRATKRTLRGYRARNGLTIRVHAVDKAGAIARHLIDEGANEFQGISFDSDQKEKAYDQLRGEAMKDALRQAKAYIGPVGLHLGRVLEISPFGNPPPRHFLLARSAKFESPETADIPIAPGTLSLETQVQVVWELVQ